MSVELDDPRSIEELLAFATRHGLQQVTRSWLARRSASGVLPRSRGPQHGGTPTYIYPAGTGARLLAVLELQSQFKKPAELRVALWVRGHDDGLAEVRQCLSSVLDDVSSTIKQAVADVIVKQHLVGTCSDIEREALNWLAAKVANSRRVVPVLPRPRSSDGYRVPALQALFQVLVTGQAPHLERPLDGLVEQGLGLWPGLRRDTIPHTPEAIGPWSDGLPVDLQWMASVIGLPALRRAITLATDEDMLVARRAVRTLTAGLSVFARAMKTAFGKNMGLTAAYEFPPSPFTETFVIANILALRQSNAKDRVDALIQFVDEVVAQLQGLKCWAQWSKHQVEAHLRPLPTSTRYAIGSLLKNLQEVLQPIGDPTQATPYFRSV